MLTPNLSPVSDSQDWPEDVDVIVIGGGIAGICAAWELKKRGQSVVVLDKGIIGGEQSCRNWGWCRQQNRDERELPLSILALQMWEELSNEIEEDLGFRRTGIVFAANKEDDLAAWEKWGKLAKNYDIETQLCSSQQLTDMLPGNQGDWIGGIHSPTDGRAEPGLAVSALAKAAQRKGVIIRQNCAVRALDFTGGCVSGVITERGRIKSEKALVAGGAWAGMLLRHHKIPFLQASIQSTCLAIDPTGFDLSPCLSMPDVSLARRPIGGYTLGISGFGTVHFSAMGIKQIKPFFPTFINRRDKLRYKFSEWSIMGPDSIQNWKDDAYSPFEKVRVLNPKPDSTLIKRVFKNLAKVYPQLERVPVLESWGGLVDCTPDGLPVISAVTGKPGLFISSGYSAHGFGVGPAAGRLASELILGNTPCVDPNPFRYERMIDGTNLGSIGMI